MLFRFFYGVILFILSLLILPKVFYQMIYKKKYRENFWKRFGCSFPEIKSNKHPVIWIHAVSMGETIAVAPLFKWLKKTNPNFFFIISNITETGHAQAKRSMPDADLHIYLPYDFRWCVKKVMMKAKPDLIIDCESDFWFNFLDIAKQQGAKIVLVNGKISERSRSNFSRFPFFAKRVFSLFDRLFLQNEEYKDRFLSLPIPPQRIQVTGNLKFDAEEQRLSSEEEKKWREDLRVRPDEFLLTLGSSHETEEQLLIDTLKKIEKKYPSVKLLLVPRHPERFNQVAALLQREELPYARFSEKEKASGKEKVFLIDGMGVLKKCYQISHLAIVGGSFVKHVGGHNILEPITYGVPVLFGPVMFTQNEMVELVLNSQSGEQVPAEKLEETILKYIEHNDLREKVGEAGRSLMKKMRGTAETTGKGILELLSEKKSNS